MFSHRLRSEGTSLRAGARNIWALVKLQTFRNIWLWLASQTFRIIAFTIAHVCGKHYRNWQHSVNHVALWRWTYVPTLLCGRIMHRNLSSDNRTRWHLACAKQQIVPICSTVLDISSYLCITRRHFSRGAETGTFRTQSVYTHQLTSYHRILSLLQLELLPYLSDWRGHIIENCQRWCFSGN